MALMIQRISIYGALLPLLVALSGLAKAQDSSYQGQSPDWGLRVEIKTNKTIYDVGEPIYLTVVLRNRGTKAVYVSKSFSDKSEDGGGPGFHIYVKPLTGKPPLVRCGSSGAESFGPRPSRTLDQAIREDYLVLSPGAIVGFEKKYATGDSKDCVVIYPGRYEVTATYSGQVLNVAKVEDGNLVTGSVLSEPSKFRVRESSARKSASGMK